MTRPKTHRALGLERAVIVTGSGTGTNNRITLDRLKRMNGAFKGLALLDPAITDAQLLELEDGGFSGFRIKANGRGGLSFDDSKRMIARTAGFNWDIEFMSQSMAEAIGAMPFLNSLKVPYVFDHVAHAEPHVSGDDHEFRPSYCELLTNEEHAWINLYSFYQLSEAGPPDYHAWLASFRRSSPTAPTIGRGSNRPHGGVRVPMPDDGDLLDFLLAAVPDEKTRNAIRRQPGKALRLRLMIREIWNLKICNEELKNCTVGALALVTSPHRAATPSLVHSTKCFPKAS